MDPDYCLEEIRRFLTRLRELDATDDEREWRDNRGDAIALAGLLAERVHALDEWLMAGGFMPRDWRKQMAMGQQAGEFALVAALIDTLGGKVEIPEQKVVELPSATRIVSWVDQSTGTFHLEVRKP